MSKRIAFVMDDIATINPRKDSTLAMIHAALQRQWQLWFMQPQWLSFSKGRVTATAQQIVSASLSDKNYYQLGTTATVALGELDVVMMRKDPPFNMQYIYYTYLLESAEQEGALVVNRPQAIRDCNEKFFATRFAAFTPPLCVSSDTDTLRAFVHTTGATILKPLDGMGGASIFKTAPDDPNLSVILETLTHNGTTTIMGQAYLPEISTGDKRILMINGEPVSHCLARIPKSGETRGNLAAGGRGVVQELSSTDRKIAAATGPLLRERGIIFAGLDVIGSQLTEINVTSPTCVREISRETGLPIAAMLLDAIAAKLG